MTFASMSGSPGAWLTRARVAYAALAVVTIGAVSSPAEASLQSHPHTAPGQSPIQSGLAFAWGDNQTGELGQGNAKNSGVPTAWACSAGAWRSRPGRSTPRPCKPRDRRSQRRDPRPG